MLHRSIATGALARRARTAAGACIVAAAVAVMPLAGATPAYAYATPGGFADLVTDVAPAVVQVTTTRSGHAAAMATRPDIPEHFREGPLKDFFERFFGEQAPQMEPRPDHKMAGLGSGFIIDSSGIVVTNNHVIDGADEITVTLKDGSELAAEVIGTDSKTDLAVLRVDTKGDLPTVKWGDSDAVRVGDWVVALGNPFGLTGTVTAGIVSARGREIGAGPYDDFIQIDAPINRGNSGGPLFDESGNVVGVNTAIFSPSGGNIGIGFAIPASVAKDVVAELVKSGSVERGWLGILIQPVTKDVAESLGLDEAAGALVANVQPDSPAEHAGLQRGDVVVGFADEDIGTVRDLTRAAAAAKVESDQTVHIRRGDKTMDVTVRMGRAPTQVASAEQPASDVELDAMGLAVAPVTDETREHFGMAEDTTGVVVTRVAGDGTAARKGLRPGDVIVQANGTDVASPKDLAGAVANAKAAKRKSILLFVERGEDGHFVAVDLADA